MLIDEEFDDMEAATLDAIEAVREANCLPDDATLRVLR